MPQLLLLCCLALLLSSTALPDVLTLAHPLDACYCRCSCAEALATAPATTVYDPTAGDDRPAGKFAVLQAAANPTGSPSVSVASPSATASRSATASPSPSPRSASPTPSGSATPSPTASPTASASPSASPSATGSPSPTASRSASPTASPTTSPSASLSPTASPSATASPSPTPSPTASPSASPSPTASRSASTSPSPSPVSPSPTPSPSQSPSPSPSASPSPFLNNVAGCQAATSIFSNDTIRDARYQPFPVGDLNGVSDLTDSQRQTLASEISSTDSYYYGNGQISYVNVATLSQPFAMSTVGSNTTATVASWGTGVSKGVVQCYPPTSDNLARYGLGSTAADAQLLCQIDRMGGNGSMVTSSPMRLNVSGLPDDGRVALISSSSTTAESLPVQKAADGSLYVILPHTSAVAFLPTSGSSGGSDAAWLAFLSFLILPVGLAIFAWMRWEKKRGLDAYYDVPAHQWIPRPEATTPAALPPAAYPIPTASPGELFDPPPDKSPASSGPAPDLYIDETLGTFNGLPPPPRLPLYNVW